MWIMILVTIVTMAGACAPERTARREPNPLEQPPVDTTVVRSADEPSEWAYHQEIPFEDARLVIAADATVGPEGIPLWEDGHRWAVYVESPGGRTLLYAALVPRGFAEAAILSAGQDGARTVLVQERMPSQLRSLEIEYEVPGKARLRSAAYYQVESWLPGAATLPDVPAGHAGPAIRLDRNAYGLAPARIGREATIVARFRAPAHQRVYLLHCNGAISWGLQRQVAGRWTDVWVAETNGCASAPIVVSAGQVRAETLTVISRTDVPPGRGPVQPAVSPGTYRLVWHNVLTAYDPHARPPGPELPVEARASAPFTISD